MILRKRPQVPRRLSGSPTGKINAVDVARSFGAGKWMAVTSALSFIGNEIRDLLPYLIAVLPLKTIAAIAFVSFGLIFVNSLIVQKRSDNTGREKF